MSGIKELDAWVSEHVLGHHLILQKKGAIKERTRLGHIRPLRSYSTDIAAAWEVAESLGITLIPIKDGSWFAFVGTDEGWETPADFLKYLQTADFASSGAAISKSAPMSICLAALRATEKRKGIRFQELATVEQGSSANQAIQ